MQRGGAELCARVQAHTLQGTLLPRHSYISYSWHTGVFKREERGNHFQPVSKSSLSACLTSICLCAYLARQLSELYMA